MNVQDNQGKANLIAHLREQIVEAVDPKQIVLFGSQAQGTARSDSDVDLLVVHDGSASNRTVRRQLEHLFLNRRFGLDLLVRTPDDVARNMADGNPFYTHHIFGKGKVLYERAQKETR